MIAMVDAEGDTIHLVHNIGARQEVVRDRLGNITVYEYDSMGNRTAVIVGNDTTKYTFEKLNRLKTVTDLDGGITTYTYDANGNRESLIYPNNTKAEYTYDFMNRLTKLLNHKSNGDTISCYTYSLGPAGNRTQVVEYTGRIVSYTYDDTYKLLQEDIDDPDFGLRTISYTYDDVGNRLQKVDNGDTTTYSYDNNDRLLTENSELETINYTYDNNGNTLTKVSATENITYSYDYQNRLIQADDGTSIVEYAYDTDGMRVQKTVDGSVTNFLLDKNRDYSQVLVESDGIGTVIVNYTYGDDLISQKRSSLTSFYHYDGQMSTCQLTDASQNITDTYTYDAFGLLLNRSGATENNYLYTGEQYDPNVGFYYLRARYYNPTVGRFLTMDTWPGMQFEPRSLHKYLYCELSPIGNLDPSGLFTLKDISITQIVISTLLSVVFYTGFRLLFTGEFPEYWEYFVVAGIGAASAFSLAILGAAKVAAIYKLLTAATFYGLRYTIISGKKGEYTDFGLILTLVTAGFAQGIGEKLSNVPKLGNIVIESGIKASIREGIKVFIKEFCAYVSKEAEDWMENIEELVRPYIEYILDPEGYIEEHHIPPTMPSFNL